MDRPPRVQSVFTEAAHWTVKKHTDLSQYNFNISVPVVLYKITRFQEFRCYIPQENGHKQQGWGHNFHGNDFAAPCHADVGRGWLGTARFQHQSLILKLSLTQQIPLSSPASLISFFSPPLLRLIYLSFFPFKPPRSSIYPSACRRVEKITETLHERRLHL